MLFLDFGYRNCHSYLKRNSGRSFRSDFTCRMHFKHRGNLITTDSTYMYSVTIRHQPFCKMCSWLWYVCHCLFIIPNNSNAGAIFNLWMIFNQSHNNYYAVLGITYCLMWNLFEFVYLQENNQEVFVDFVEVLTDVIDVVSYFNISYQSVN